MKKSVLRLIASALFFLNMMSLCACGKKEAEIQYENWKPTKTVTIICGYGVGGSSDLFARILAKELSDYWGINVIVNNIEGASGAIGTTECFNAAPDGSTVFVSNGATITQSVQGDVEWKYSEFTNIAKVIDEDEILCVSNKSKINSLDELIELCKKEPGKVSIGVAGVGGYTYLAAQRFIKEQNIDVKIVAYDSGAEVVSAVMGRFVDFCIQQPAELYSGIESEQLKALAIMAKNRHDSSVLSNILTSEEQNVDFVMNQWRGISAPGNLPEGIKEEWINALQTISQKESFYNDVDNILHARVNFTSGSEFDSFLEEEDKWVERVMKEIGMVD